MYFTGKHLEKSGVMRKKRSSSEPENKFLETDLYPPVRDFFVRQGYTVRSEVKDCDVSAFKDGQLIIIELKRNLSLELLSQAVKRQKLTDLVYMAVPKPQRMAWNQKWRDLFHLFRRLELGLIFVSMQGDTPRVEVAIDPQPFDRSRSMVQNQRKRNQVLKELQSRTIDGNLGGSQRKKLVTAYRESAIEIACCLEMFGPMSPKQLRDLGTDPKKTASILRDNFYGWFDHLERGLYGLSQTGKESLRIYNDLAEYYREKLQKLSVNRSFDTSS